MSFTIEGQFIFKEKDQIGLAGVFLSSIFFDFGESLFRTFNVLLERYI